MKALQTYATVENMIEEKAAAQHRANLQSGGVFNADGTPFSDIKIERVAAKAKVKSSPLYCALIIEGFGIVKP